MKIKVVTFENKNIEIDLSEDMCKAMNIMHKLENDYGWSRRNISLYCDGNLLDRDSAIV